jgi:retinol dehydrogenase-12
MWWALMLAVLALLLLVRHKQRGSKCPVTPNLNSRTIVITGGDRGIGRETALGLARLGARVVLLCREMGDGARVR